MEERTTPPRNQGRRPGRHRSPIEQPRLNDGAWTDPWADAFGLELHHGRHDGAHGRPVGAHGRPDGSPAPRVPGEQQPQHPTE